MKVRLRPLLIGTAALLTTACATGEEMTTWKEHPTHFASGDHLMFSMKNREASKPRVTRTDIAKARDEGWWGKPVTVATDQILEK